MATVSVQTPSRMIVALCGGLVVGTLIPTVLIAMNLVTGDSGTGLVSQSIKAGWFRGLMLFELFMCGPGAIILSGLIMATLRGIPKENVPNHRLWIKQGAGYGALLAFLNFPGYGAAYFLDFSGMMYLQLPVLFVAGGVPLGAWVGWQAYREADPKASFWPQFTLAELMMCVIIWGVLLACFSH